jgi:chromosome segregation ATPase
MVDLEVESREGALRELKLRSMLEEVERERDALRDARSDLDSIRAARMATERATRELVEMEAERDRWVERVKELEDRLSRARAALDGRP